MTKLEIKVDGEIWDINPVLGVIERGADVIEFDELPEEIENEIYKLLDKDLVDEEEDFECICGATIPDMCMCNEKDGLSIVE